MRGLTPIDAAQPRVSVPSESDCFRPCPVLLDRSLRLGAAPIGVPTNDSTPRPSGRRLPLPRALSEPLRRQGIGIGGRSLDQPFKPSPAIEGVMSDDTEGDRLGGGPVSSRSGSWPVTFNGCAHHSTVCHAKA